jgi:Peptide N-acetyl-beta-D-glucosaminyl asparaginase amidase A
MKRALLALAVLVFALATPTAASAAPFVEPYTDNPVTAEPPVSRPGGPHCTVTLADHFLSNAADGTPQNFSGTLTPPADCAGPWAKVVMDYTVSVSGRQYDRIGDLNIGGTEVYWGTTEEPSGPTPITYTVSKDLTEYSALLRGSQPFNGGITNYTSDVYTGIYEQTVTLTYYPGRAPAGIPDAVVGFPGHDQSSDVAHFSRAGLPRNITRAELEVTLEGHGCDEQWFADVPADVSAKYPSAGMCTHGPYREADFSLDGKPVAAVHTFPHIYTGGIVPTLWRPIPAIHTFSLYAEHVDITPFAGLLVDGGTHDLAVSVQNAGDTWTVVATLLLYTDHHAEQTHGALVTDDVAPTATERTAETAVDSGDTRVVDSTSRTDVTAGWLDTSAGRVYTRVVRTMAYRNDDTVTNGGWSQRLVQHDSGGQTSTSTINGHVVAGTNHTYDYPLTVNYTIGSYVDSQNYSLSGTVDMTQTLSDAVAQGGGWQPTTRSTEYVDSDGILTRTNGVVTESDGNSTSRYAGDNDQGEWYVHYLASDHGLITKDL